MNQFLDNACYSNPCFNGGICNPNGYGYTCDCPKYFTGTACQTCIYSNF